MATKVPAKNPKTNLVIPIAAFAAPLTSGLISNKIADPFPNMKPILPINKAIKINTFQKVTKSNKVIANNENPEIN